MLGLRCLKGDVTVVPSRLDRPPRTRGRIGPISAAVPLLLVLLPACPEHPERSESDPPLEEDDDTLPEAYTVSATTTGEGEIAPAGATAVASGQTLGLTLTPDAGMEPSDVQGTCGGVLDGLEFTTDPVLADCTVLASFRPVEVEPAAYCSEVPADLQDLVACDPDLNLDDWSSGGSSGINGLVIPTGRILALPFTANAAGSTGFVEITNNMPGLVSTGLNWHGWFSVVPGGERVEEDNPYCRRFSPNPNPIQLQWNQTEPAQWECYLGVAPRTLYFNMEVACIPELDTGCTPGERYDEDYWLQLTHATD